MDSRKPVLKPVIEPKTYPDEPRNPDFEQHLATKLKAELKTLAQEGYKSFSDKLKATTCQNCGKHEPSGLHQFYDKDVCDWCYKKLHDAMDAAAEIRSSYKREHQ